MEKLDAIMYHAEQHCKTQGARLTAKRKQVLEGLVSSEKALSAYELVDLCKEKFGESIPPMTVYRILDFLEHEKLVHKLNLANKYVACSHITCDHAHGIPQFLICGNCQRVEEITIQESTIAELKENISRVGFNLVSPQLEMNCICDKCLNNVV